MKIKSNSIILGHFLWAAQWLAERSGGLDSTQMAVKCCCGVFIFLLLLHWFSCEFETRMQSVKTKTQSLLCKFCTPACHIWKKTVTERIKLGLCLNLRVLYPVELVYIFWQLDTEVWCSFLKTKLLCFWLVIITDWDDLKWHGPTLCKQAYGFHVFEHKQSKALKPHVHP